MPVWHEALRPYVQDGRLVVLGVTQEQHPERCVLFAQWKQFDWPILHDPINILSSSAVPILVAIDQHGIVRSTRPRTTTFAEEFLEPSFADDSGSAMPERYGPRHPPDLIGLGKAAEASGTARDHRAFGDALALWGGPERLDDAIAAYSTAAAADPQDAPARFRLGVMLRRRYESSSRKGNDFQDAIANWGRALELDPNQYIWRRRIQQYGPRLDKPYPFYDWVAEAEQAIRARGEQPVSLPVRPDGAEIASPQRSFSTSTSAARSPDPAGNVTRIAPDQIQAEVTVVPRFAIAGQTARVHLVLRVNPESAGVHWNNESEPLRVWLEPPTGWELNEPLLTAALPPTAVSHEDRRLEFEVQVAESATADGTIRGYALFHVCEEDGGTCRFVRRDLELTVPVKRAASGKK